MEDPSTPCRGGLDDGDGACSPDDARGPMPVVSDGTASEPG